MTTRTTISAQNDRSDMIASAYRAMYGKVYGYVAKRIGLIADVEDLVQDTFESLLHPERLLSEHTLDRYIYSIAHNLVVDWYRRHACSIKAQDYFFAHSPLTSEEADVRMRVADIIRLEKEVLDKASENARTVYMMFVHEGSSAKEIAEKMNIGIRAVENHVFRLRNKVRISINKAV